MHIYDTSSLQVLRHAQVHANNEYGQVIIDAKAMEARKFALEQLGTRIKVLSVTPSTHTDKFGGTSTSMMVQVIGVGLIEPTKVIEKMPFMTVECADDDALLSNTDRAPDGAAALGAELAKAAALCETLDDVTSFKGPLTREAEKADAGEAWSLDACIKQVLSLRAAPDAEASRLVLSALATTVHLPGPLKLKAMRLAKDGHVQELCSFVAAELDEEGKRRLAKKAIVGISSDLS